MPHRQREIVTNSRIGIARALVNLDQIVDEVRVPHSVFLRRDHVGQVVGGLPTATKLRAVSDIVQIFLRRFLFVREIAKQKKNSDADRNNDEREQKKLRDKKGRWLCYFAEIVCRRDRHTS